MIDAHPLLRSCGASKSFADYNSDTYECDQCHTKFERLEGKPSRKVTWSVTE